MAIAYLFNTLFLILPLVFFTKTSEVFEFNKIVTVYIFTVVIVGLWIIKMITNKKIIFRRTILDIPILLFLGTQIISTVLSIDIRTSIFGYYSRFNGGLASSISYALLYWAYVANVSQKENRKNILVLIISGVIVSIYGVLEHFGHSLSCVFVTGKFDDECWVQDVQLRVFATLGQPNWLAAYLVALIPISNFQFTISKQNSRKLIWVAISILFFAALIFTKSRSGLLAFGVASIIFWGFYLLKSFKKSWPGFLVLNLVFLGLFLIFNNPFKVASVATPVGPALETGGTESGEIRKIVWQGAFDIWRAYPITGSGVETFAYSYYQFRPAAHNLVSEWDFLYNKAHNEYLNYLATTGTLGFLAYLGLIIVSLYQIMKAKNIALFAGYITILVTNFFGFSVVLISFLTFIFPAIATVSSSKYQVSSIDTKNTTNDQKILICLVILAAGYLLLNIGRYWQADYLYSLGKREYQAAKYVSAARDVRSAIDLSPTEAVFHQELSTQYANYALGLLEQKEATAAATLADAAIAQGKDALDLSPRNVIVRRAFISSLINLSVFDQSLLISASDLIKSTMIFAPTDPRLPFTLGKVYYRMGQDGQAISALEKAVELKPNYTDARIALEGLYKKEGKLDKAREQLEYVLRYITPNDASLKEELNSLGK